MSGQQAHRTGHADANWLLVYSVNKAVIADGVGRRLENFFWRIWSSRKVLHRISGRQVARQFQQISEGGYFRTTPTQSPRISRSLGTNETGSSSDGGAPASPREISAPVDPPPVAMNEGQEEKREQDSLVSQVGSVSSRAQETVAPLPSILKKPKVAFATHASKTAKALYPDNSLPRKVGDDDDGGGVPLSAYAPCAGAANDEGASSSQARHQVSPTENGSSTVGDERGPRKRNRDREKAMTTEQSVGSQENVKPKSAGNRTVRAKGGASKTRPLITQRKSSHSSSSATPQLRASPITGTEVESAASIYALDVDRENATLDQEQPVMQRSRRGSPHPSQRRGGPTEDQPVSDDSRGEPQNKAKGIEDGLVDRNFRSSFAIRSRGDGHLFAPFPGKSTAAAATSAEDQAIGTTGSTQNANDQWSEHFTDEIVSLKPPGPSGPRARDDSETQPLARTMSQLTLLLERDRQRSRDGNYRTEPR